MFHLNMFMLMVFLYPFWSRELSSYPKCYKFFLYFILILYFFTLKITNHKMSEDFDINVMTEDFIKMCCNNDPDTINYYNEIREFRAYSQVKDFRKVIDENFNNFCFNNSLIHKINFGLLNDNQLLFYRILSYAFENGERNIFKTLPSDFKNRLIIEYYMKHLNENIENVKLEDLKNVCGYWYDNIPSRYLIKQGKIKEVKEIAIKEIIKPNFDLINHTLDFLKIGNALLFNVDGFAKNQICLLLYGMAVYYAWIKLKNKEFKSFKQLVNYLKSFIQINTYSKCLDVLDYKDIVTQTKGMKVINEQNDFYNLITYLKLKTDGKSVNYNYRYKCAEKYFKEQNRKTNTKTVYEELPTGESYIKTIYKNIDEVKKAWDDLEEEFKEHNLTDKLITIWFDGQLLTRSTCLIGCMLIMLKEGKFIEFNKDEMPDWKAIAVDTYEGTYKTKDELKVLDDVESNLKLVDVLYMLYNFMNNIKLQFN